MSKNKILILSTVMGGKVSVSYITHTATISWSYLPFTCMFDDPAHVTED